MISSGLHAILIKVAAFGLDPEKHLGKSLEEMRPHLKQLSAKYGVHVCGEGGEYETLTLDCPLFSKKIAVDSTEVIMHSNDAFAPVAYLRPLKLHLKDKEGNAVLDDKKMCPCGIDQLVPHESELHTLAEDEQLTFVPQECPSGGVHWSSRTRSGFQWISEVTSCGSNVQEAAVFGLSSFKVQVEDKGLQMSDAVLVYLYVQSMDDFAAINAEYGKLFPVAPPARVCVQCCLPRDTVFKMDVLFWLPVPCRDDFTAEKIAMHVQSISHWAPANIGPYSQAVRVGNGVFCAGQIALKPCTMQLISGRIEAESRLSLRHVGRVLDAMAPGTTLRHVMVAQCYVTQSSYIQTALETWKGSFEEQDITLSPTVVVVPKLPRGAAVEWHVLASASDPDDQNHFSASVQRSGYQALLSGTISSCKTCASLVLSVSALSPQKPALDWHHVSHVVEDVLQKASAELSSHDVIPVCCRTFYRSDNLQIKHFQEDLPGILRKVWGDNAPCLVWVPVIDLLSSELLNMSIWLSC